MTLTDSGRHLVTGVTELAELAELVASPAQARPFYIGPDNALVGHARSISEAVSSGRAFAITVGPDVLAFDLDDATLLDRADRLARLISTWGWPVLRVVSGRDGHCHLWAVVPSASARHLVRAEADSLGLPRPRAKMRPPLAPHRLGLPVEPLDDVETFCDRVRQVRRNSSTSMTWRATLRTGARKVGKDASGSATVWSICVGAIREGLTLDEVRALLLDPDHLGGRPYRHKFSQLGRDKADRWLAKSVWPGAERSAENRSPRDAEEARARLRGLSENIEVHAWSGRAGVTDRAVLRAIVARGMRRGSLTPEMSYREIAEAAPCSLRTVAAAVKRLRAGGWLLVSLQGRGATETDADGSFVEVARSTRWQLCAPESALTFHTGGTPPSSTCSDVATKRARIDVGRWGGLGLNAPRVLDLLSEGSLSTREVSERLHLNLGHLRSRLLPKLAGHGLIVRTETGWEIASDLDVALTQCAEDLGLAGKAERVAEGHRAERLAYLDYRERTRPERAERQVEAVARAVPMIETALRAQRPSLVITEHHTEEAAHA